MFASLLGWVVLLLIAIVFGVLTLFGLVLAATYSKGEGLTIAGFFGALTSGFGYAAYVNIPFMCFMIVGG